MTHTYTPAESALCAAARAVLTEQCIAGGVLPIPGTSMIVAFGEREQIAMLAAPSAQQAAGSIDTLAQQFPMLWARPVLYTDTLEGNQVCRDDLWAVTTQELSGLLAAATPAQPIAPPAKLKPMTTDEAREYLIAFMEQHFSDKTFHRYIRADPVDRSRLAGDFAWQMATALRRLTPVAQPIAVSAPTDDLSLFDIDLMAKKFPLPETRYNGCGDGSEPLYTPEMMYLYAHQHIVAMAHARKPELDKALAAARAAAPVSGPTENQRDALRWLLNISESHDQPEAKVADLLDLTTDSQGKTTRERLEELYAASAAPVSGQGASEDDPTALWARIHRLEADAKGPEGFATWKDAALAERLLRVKAAQAGEQCAPNLIEAISALDMLFPDGCQEPGALVRFSDVSKIVHAYIGSRPRSEDSLAEVQRDPARWYVWHNNQTAEGANLMEVLRNGKNLRTEAEALMAAQNVMAALEQERIEEMMERARRDHPECFEVGDKLVGLASTTPQKADDE